MIIFISQKYVYESSNFQHPHVKSCHLQIQGAKADIPKCVIIQLLREARNKVIICMRQTQNFYKSNIVFKYFLNFRKVVNFEFLVICKLQRYNSRFGSFGTAVWPVDNS